jgi:hypothetical protein
LFGVRFVITNPRSNALLVRGEGMTQRKSSDIAQEVVGSTDSRIADWNF